MTEIHFFFQLIVSMSFIICHCSFFVWSWPVVEKCVTFLTTIMQSNLIAAVRYKLNYNLLW
jgi:hypothetical protein